MTSLSPQAVAKSVRDLPALPAVVMELIRSLDDPKLTIEHLARQISLDQAIAAKTLRLANSSFFGLTRQVTSVLDAASVLGLQSVRNIATAAGVAGVFSVRSCPGFDFSAFWRHSIATALCAEVLAQSLDQEAGTAFTLGLLHDIGRLALASGFPEQYAEVVVHRQLNDCLPLEAERAVLDTDHCVVGSLIAEQWRFAPVLIEAIALHHEPRDDEGSPPLDLVHLADNMAHALDLSQDADDLVPPLSKATWARLNLSEATLMTMFSQVERRHEAVCQALMM